MSVSLVASRHSLLPFLIIWVNADVSHCDEAFSDYRAQGFCYWRTSLMFQFIHVWVFRSVVHRDKSAAHTLRSDGQQLAHVHTSVSWTWTCTALWVRAVGQTASRLLHCVYREVDGPLWSSPLVWGVWFCPWWTNTCTLVMSVPLGSVQVQLCCPVLSQRRGFLLWSPSKQSYPFSLILRVLSWTVTSE